MKHTIKKAAELLIFYFQQAFITRKYEASTSEQTSFSSLPLMNLQNAQKDEGGGGWTKQLNAVLPPYRSLCDVRSRPSW